MIRRKAVNVDELPEDLGVDWARWSDGRAYRLKRKRDFPNVSPGVARSACEVAAHRMGKAIRTARDRRVPDKLLWIQFADAYVGEGKPCPKCGSRRLYELHAKFARCPQCKAQLIISSAGIDAFDDDNAAVVGPRARQRLTARLKSLTDVRLEHAGENEASDIFNGYGMVEDTPVIILAEFEKDETGEELSLTNMFDRVARVKVFPADSMSGLVDINTLRNRPESDWDLVLEPSN